MSKKLIHLVYFVLAVGLVSSVSVASAGTIVYWRFDDVGDADIEQWGPVAAGNPLPDSDGQTIWRKAAHDHSGNGNHLTTWEYAWAGFEWSSDVGETIVPLTGASNALSMVNTGDWPASMTWSEQSSPSGTDIEGITPATFTIEASFKMNVLGGYHTIVGRDGMNAVSGDPAPAPLYFQIRPNNVVAVQFADLDGYAHVAESPINAVTTGQWYHMVAVSDGSTLSLYLNYALVAQTDMTISGSTNTALAIGSGSGADWEAGTWTVSRGLFNGGHVDRVYGYVDEVRISDTALAMSEFLFIPVKASNPHPSDGASTDGYTYQDDVYEMLEFTAGLDAVKHTGYFSANEQDVIDRIEDANIGQPPYPQYPTRFYIGLSITPPYKPSLVRGTWYYWCVDEIDDEGQLWPGDVWSFYLGTKKASDATPTDGQRFLSLTPTLSWGSGVGAEEHDIFFGTSFAAVNDANFWDADPEFKATQLIGDEDWEPVADGGLTLNYDTDYYWRIDEIAGRIFPTVRGEWVKGDVWKFTTMPDIPITDANLVGWWKLDDENSGTTVPDYSGHDNHGTINGDPEWVGGMIGGALELDGTDDHVALPIGSVISSLTNSTFMTWVDFSNAGGSWQRIFDFGSNTTAYMFLTPRIGLDGAMRFAITIGGGGAAEQMATAPSTLPSGWYNVAVTINADNDTIGLYLDGSLVAENTAATLTPSDLGNTTNNWLGRSQYSADAYFDGSLDDFRIYDYALSQSELRRAAAPPEAWSPSPANGTLVDPTEFVECTWRAGGDAAQHRVYWCVGDDPNLLALVATKPLAEPNYDPGTLAFETSYCWRVDEVNGLDVVTGNVWKFSTVREAGMGSILVEQWLNLLDLAAGNDLRDLTDDPRYPDNPDTSYEVPSFDSGTGLADNYGGRIHGWLIPDTTGDYRFWLTTDDAGELWLNPDSADPSGAELIAYIPADNWADPYTWNTHTTQDSNNVAGGLIHLEADQRYYICGLWKEGTGSDHCQVAWQGPDQPLAPVNGSDDAVIDGYYLMPFTRLWASNPKPRHRQELSAEDVTLLSWRPGIEAATHDVYFGTSLSDVNESATPVATGLALDVNYYDPNPGPFDVNSEPITWETSYFWRIDEVNGSDIWTGGIWWFRTTNYALLDDFESYLYAGGSGDPNGVRYVWKDGWSFFPAVKSGSNLMLGGIDEQPRPYLHYNGYNPHPAEDQGMVFYYDNDGNTSVPGWPGYVYSAPKYSELEAATTGINGLGVGRDWLRQDLRSLSLWFRGHPTRDGSFSYTGSGLGPYTATIISDGTDIWNVGPNPYHDEFHYAYLSLLGSGGYVGAANIIARIDSVEDTDPWAKAGVMMRESLAVDSNHAMVVVTPGSGVSFQYRDV
jgi:hypothetical protein